MNRNGDPDIVCWDCIKGRHAICIGVVPYEDSDTENHGKACECPVCHGSRYEERQPVWDAARECYYDPGPGAERRDRS